MKKIILGSVLMTLLMACGQKGALYLPSQGTAPAPAATASQQPTPLPASEPLILKPSPTLVKP